MSLARWLELSQVFFLTQINLSNYPYSNIPGLQLPIEDLWEAE